MWLIFSGSAQHQQPYFRFVVMLCLASDLPGQLDWTRFACTVYEMHITKQRRVSHMVIMPSIRKKFKKKDTVGKPHCVPVSFPQSRDLANASVPFLKKKKNSFSFSPPKKKASKQIAG